MPVADRFDTLLTAARLRLARGPLAGWWRTSVQTLLPWLPASWRAFLAGAEQRLYLQRDGDEIVLVAAGSRGETALGRLPREARELLDAVRDRLNSSHAAVWLLLPASGVLRRRLALPAAAEPRLRELLAHELDRQTPFSADQVSYQGRVLSRDPAGQQLQVELLVVPRARLEAELQAIGPLAEGLSGVDVIEDGGQRLGLNLLPDSRRDQRRDPGRQLTLALSVGVVLGLAAVLLMTLHNRDQRLRELRELVAEQTQAARQARLLRNQVATSVQAANFLAATRASRPTMLEVLDDLTRRIPDDTSIDKLSVNEGKLVMVGQSRAAPALVALLQESPLLVEPALSGAVQADPRSGRDRFTLTATVVEIPGEDADARSP